MSRTKVRLKLALPTTFVFLISMTGLLIILVNYFISAGALKFIARNYINEVSEHTLKKTIAYLEPAAQMAQMNAVLLRPSEEGGSYLVTFNDVTTNELMTYPQFALVYFGDEQGNFWNTARAPDLSLKTQLVERLVDNPESKAALEKALKMPRGNETEQQAVAAVISPFMRTVWLIRDQAGVTVAREYQYDYPYDPRLRGWYKLAREKGQVKWTSPYMFSSSGLLYASGKPGITVTAPVYRHNVFVGAVGVDIILEEISSFLSKLKIGRRGRAFIIDPQGQTVGLPDYSQLAIRLDGVRLKFNNIENVSHQAMAESYRVLHRILGSCTYDPVDLAKLRRLEENQENLFHFKSGGEWHFGFYMPFPQDFGLDLLVGIVVPEDDFLGEVRRNIYIGSAISLAFLLLVIWVSMGATKRVTLPINRIAEEAERIKNFELDGSFEVDTPFTEIDNLTASVRNMQAGLKSFRKYVPADLVRFLIQSGQEAALGGRGHQVTVFFSDIANFTNIAESMKEHDLVLHLGEFLGEMSRIILSRKGTVDKYIGDAIMAFWNAPRNVPDHAVQACLAALECQKKYGELSLKWKARGLPDLRSRIGINTGRVVVGNMGTVERLNYTVLGDDVNVASRLEGLGKQYNVWIIIGPNTQAAVRDVVETRHLDRVAVKGKTTGLNIYELVGVKGEMDRETLEFITAYEIALQAYFQRDFDTAFNLFRAAQQQRPEDLATRLFLQRCHRYRTTPPPDDWDGTFVMTKK
ncbi:MAG: adenylate/guanylate cyclase domain-containing protein [Thermodesulfobacteriota bacterium]